MIARLGHIRPAAYSVIIVGDTPIAAANSRRRLREPSEFGMASHSESFIGESPPSQLLPVLYFHCNKKSSQNPWRPHPVWLEIAAMPKRGAYLRKQPPSQKAREKAHFLREWREYFGWSQEEIAERSGLSVASISAYERGENAPSLDALGLIALAFDVKRGLLLDVNPTIIEPGAVTFTVPPADHHKQSRRPARAR